MSRTRQSPSETPATALAASATNLLQPPVREDGGGVVVAKLATNPPYGVIHTMPKGTIVAVLCTLTYSNPEASAYDTACPVMCGGRAAIVAEDYDALSAEAGMDTPPVKVLVQRDGDGIFMFTEHLEVPIGSVCLAEDHVLSDPGPWILRGAGLEHIRTCVRPAMRMTLFPPSYMHERAQNDSASLASVSTEIHRGHVLYTSAVPEERRYPHGGQGLKVSNVADGSKLPLAYILAIYDNGRGEAMAIICIGWCEVACDVFGGHTLYRIRLNDISNHLFCDLRVHIVDPLTLSASDQAAWTPTGALRTLEKNLALHELVTKMLSGVVPWSVQDRRNACSVPLTLDTLRLEQERFMKNARQKLDDPEAITEPLPKRQKRSVKPTSKLEETGGFSVPRREVGDGPEKLKAALRDLKNEQGKLRKEQNHSEHLNKQLQIALATNKKCADVAQELSDVRKDLAKQKTAVSDLKLKLSEKTQECKSLAKMNKDFNKTMKLLTTERQTVQRQSEEIKTLSDRCRQLGNIEAEVSTLRTQQQASGEELATLRQQQAANGQPAELIEQANMHVSFGWAEPQDRQDNRRRPTRDTPENAYDHPRPQAAPHGGSGMPDAATLQAIVAAVTAQMQQSQLQSSTLPMPGPPPPTYPPTYTNQPYHPPTPGPSYPQGMPQPQSLGHHFGAPPQYPTYDPRRYSDPRQPPPSQ